MLKSVIPHSQSVCLSARLSVCSAAKKWVFLKARPAPVYSGICSDSESRPVVLPVSDPSFPRRVQFVVH